MFPGFQRLHVLSEPGGSQAFRADVALSTEQAFAVTRQECLPSATVTATWSSGALRPRDVIWTSVAAPVMISERVVKVLVELGARGWSTYEVQVVGRRGETIVGYRGLSVHGRCGVIDNGRSVEVPRIYPGGVFPVWKGVYFDPESWDGSGVFMTASRVGWIFVTDDVRQAFEKARIKDVLFRPLDSIERSKVQMAVEMNP